MRKKTLKQQEIEEGDPKAAQVRLELVRGIAILELTPDVINLADKLLDAKAIPREVKLDAYHVACAAVYRIDFLVTWNQKHIASDRKRDLIKAVIGAMGLHPPRILTPEIYLIEEL